MPSGHELEALVAFYFCQGKKPKEVCELLEREHQIEITIKSVHEILKTAGAKHRLRYIPADDGVLRDELKIQYPSANLNRIEVVGSPLLRDLAYRTAETLLDLIREIHRKKEQVHIGFAGGGTLLEVARAFNSLLRDPQRNRDVPHKLIFHSMVAGWDVDQPEKDPNSFSVIMVGNPVTNFDFRFVGLHAPGIVRMHKYNELRELEGIRDAFDVMNKIDVIVTSAGRWDCKHSELYRLYAKYEESTLEELEKARCVGDLMWCPFGPDGQINPTVPTSIRTFTLMSINDLDDFICNQSKHVLLALGPCSGCGKTKTEIFRTIAQLGSRRRFVTHLVCDSRTASELIH